MKLAALIIVSLLVAMGRFLVPGHELSMPGTYEALAHIWVGVLLCLAIREWPRPETEDWFDVPATYALTILTFLEVVMFLRR